MLDRLDGRVSIPMAGRAESLNVSVAAAVLCFEVLRQRRTARTAPAGTAQRPTIDDMEAVRPGPAEQTGRRTGGDTR